MASYISPASSAAVAAEACLFILVTIVLYYSFLSRRPKDFPPGPPTLPLLGNIHQFPATKGFLKFHEWGREYGSIIGLKIGPQNVVILNDHKHVQELFDRRGSKYSSRPTSHIANDLIFKNSTLVLTVPYGHDWKVLRKVFHGLLGASAVDVLKPIQNAEATQTVHQLLHDSHNWHDHLRRFPAGIILASVYGIRGRHFNSPRVKDVYHIVNQFTEISEFGATPPIDIFPFLKYLPDFLSPWRPWAARIHKHGAVFWTDMMAETKLHTQQGYVADCFMARLIREQEKSGLDDEHIAYIGGTFLMAGSDTIASTLLSFMLALAKHPKVLQKCQQEVDNLCGTFRLPATEDIPSLPYTNATLNETLRWRPAVAGGVPHTLIEDDYYDSYFLPKGTMLFINSWSIHRTSEFAEPDRFMPERFLDNKFGTINDGTGNRNSNSDDRRRVHYGFGAGRRVCSGQRMAENALLIIIAKLVWAFNISSSDPVDDNIETAYTDGFLMNPRKFSLEIEPRSAEHTQTMEREYLAAEQFMSQFKD